jgi:hypothetical protein
MLPRQRDELLPKGEVFEDKIAAGTQEPNRQCHEKRQQAQHSSILTPATNAP